MRVPKNDSARAVRGRFVLVCDPRGGKGAPRFFFLRIFWDSLCYAWGVKERPLGLYPGLIRIVWLGRADGLVWNERDACCKVCKCHFDYGLC